MESKFEIRMYKNCRFVGEDKARLGHRQDVGWSAAVCREAHRGEDARVCVCNRHYVLMLNDRDDTVPTSETDRAGFLAGSVSARQYLDDEHKKTIEEECRDEESEEIDFDA